MFTSELADTRDRQGTIVGNTISKSANTGGRTSRIVMAGKGYQNAAPLLTAFWRVRIREG